MTTVHLNPTTAELTLADGYGPIPGTYRVSIVPLGAGHPAVDAEFDEAAVLLLRWLAQLVEDETAPRPTSVQLGDPDPEDPRLDEGDLRDALADALEELRSLRGAR